MVVFDQANLEVSRNVGKLACKGLKRRKGRKWCREHFVHSVLETGSWDDSVHVFGLENMNLGQS